MILDSLDCALRRETLRSPNFAPAVTQSEQERSCILLVRLQTSRSGWLWIHAVLQVKDGSDSSQQPVIVCTNQVLR